MDGIKIFSATKHRDRSTLGEKATEWLGEQKSKPGFEVIDKVVTQSSDNEFHCLTITLFFKLGEARRGPRK